MTQVLRSELAFWRGTTAWAGGAFELESRPSGQALKGANIDVQSDCCEGLCGSCETRVLSGAVDHRDVVLTRGERDAQDRMMVCCSRAAGDKLVLEL